MVSGLLSIPQQAPLCASDAAGSAAAPRCSRYLAGPENSLVSRALAAVQAPSPQTNPLVITGVSGTGKTLLLELLADEFQRRFARVAVVVTTAVDLARAYAHAVQTDAINEFRQRYGRLHLLAIDDVQRLAGKEPAQQELLQLVDSLVSRGCLVLATLRSHPLDAPELSYPLASRLASGLVVPLALPEAAARRALIEHFAASAEVELPSGVAESLIKHGLGRHRLATATQLRHAVIALGELARRSGRPADRELVDEYLATRDADAKATIQTIAAAVSKEFEISVADLRGKSRMQSVTAARGLAMHLARELSGASYAEIGRYFGNRDHTTVMHACKKTALAAVTEQSLKHLVGQLTTRLAAEEPGA